jgi:hypothetical protein
MSILLTKLNVVCLYLVLITPKRCGFPNKTLGIGFRLLHQPISNFFCPLTMSLVEMKTLDKYCALMMLINVLLIVRFSTI